MTRSFIKTIAFITFASLLLFTVCGCAAVAHSPEQPAAEQVRPSLEDGIYSVSFSTDSSMFHVNEADKGMGVLTVKNGKMTLHVRMPSKNVVNLFPGTAEDAKAKGAVLLRPVCENVSYDDGMTDEVFAYDIPVPTVGQEFDLALLGTKGKWYDHKVIVSDPISVE